MFDEYKRYRNASREFHSKVIEAEQISREDIERAGKLLGFMQDGRLVFKSDSETDILFDFLIYDYQIDGENVIEKFQEDYQHENRLEKEILSAMLDSYTSLFQVEKITDQRIQLYDLINENRIENFIDINLIRTGNENFIMFLRRLKFQNFSMSSGVSFLYEKASAEELLSEYENRKKGILLADEAMKSVIVCKKLYDEKGLPVSYGKIQ